MNANTIHPTFQYKTVAQPAISFGSFKPLPEKQNLGTIEKKIMGSEQSLRAHVADSNHAPDPQPSSRSETEVAHDLTNGSDDDDDVLDGLAAVVDDIAYRFWKCGRCLTMAHDTKDCTRRIRCRF